MTNHNAKKTCTPASALAQIRRAFAQCVTMTDEDIMFYINPQMTEEAFQVAKFYNKCVA